MTTKMQIVSTQCEKDWVRVCGAVYNDPSMWFSITWKPMEILYGIGIPKTATVVIYSHTYVHIHIYMYMYWNYYKVLAL